VVPDARIRGNAEVPRVPAGTGARDRNAWEAVATAWLLLLPRCSREVDADRKLTGSCSSFPGGRLPKLETPLSNE